MAAARTRPRVVIAGMGDTGVLVATRLSRHLEVVGVSTTPMFVSGQELGTRLTRPRQWRRDYLNEFSDYRRLRGVRVLHGEVASVDLDTSMVHVRLAGGGEQSVDYDALVVATGTTNGFWRGADVRTRDDVESGVVRGLHAVLAAGRVVVVGGGPSGVSVASNVADTRPEVDVALYHGGDLPLPGYHPRTRRRVVRRLEAQGVALRPGHRAIVPEGASRTLGPATVQWATGQQPVDADLVVWAVGDVRPNTSTLPTELLDDDGWVRVDPTLRVPGHPRVFAVGDVAATDPLRSSARNFGHRVAAHNVRAVLAGREHQLRRFHPPHHRWGSVLGLQHDGMRIFTPRGGMVKLAPPLVRHVLLPWLTHQLIYGGLRRRTQVTGRD